jgi:hypothetical protein
MQLPTLERSRVGFHPSTQYLHELRYANPSCEQSSLLVSAKVL